ncbi:hypothetical protein Tco_0811068 [Tanacetum coccineum]
MLVLAIRVILPVPGETIQEDRQGLLNAIIVKTEDLDAYDSDCGDVSNAKAVLMANLSNYSSDFISEVPHSEPYHNDMDNQSVHAMQDFEQTPVVDFSANEITSNSNIIPYSQYWQETQQAAVQDTNLYAQQDSMILSVIEQMSEQMTNHEKESLLQTFTVFKNESKEKESKYMENEIDLEKKIKELDNIVYKVGQSTQTVHMLTKPQVFYDDTRKQALGYQNLFYLKKAQWIKPTLYDGSVISSQHATSHVIDDEETLTLEELNKLFEDFGKRFVPQQELSAEHAFWLQTSNPNTEQSNISPGRIEAPSELPKVSLVNTSFKNIKIHLSKFNTVKKWIIPAAITEGNGDVMICVMNSTAIFDDVNLEMQSSEYCVKCLDLDAELLNKQNAYNDLSKSYSQLEKLFISFELTMQLNQEIFQKDSFSDNQNALEIPEYFENNDLKAQVQAKNNTICKLKEHIKSIRENDKKEKVNMIWMKLRP